MFFGFILICLVYCCLFAAVCCCLWLLWFGLLGFDCFCCFVYFDCPFVLLGCCFVDLRCAGGFGCAVYWYLLWCLFVDLVFLIVFNCLDYCCGFCCFIAVATIGWFYYTLQIFSVDFLLMICLFSLFVFCFMFV